MDNTSLMYDQSVNLSILKFVSQVNVRHVRNQNSGSGRGGGRGGGAESRTG